MSAITVADDRALVTFILKAERRLLFLAPAVSQPVAEALVNRLEFLGGNAVTITLDVDAETYRLGYGDPGTLDRLYEVTRRHDTPLRRQAGLRIGLVISDDLMMVYAPTPLLIGAGSQQENRPNAVIVGPPPLPVLREMGFGENGYSDQTIGLDLAKDMEIKPVLDDLQINPPQKFDLARTVRVFNAHIEFVDFNLVGASIARKTVRIPARLMGLAGDEATARLLRASFQVVDHADNLSGEHLEHDKKLIVRTFLKTLPEYGTAILRTQKEEFEKAVSKLRDDVDTFQKKDPR